MKEGKTMLNKTLITGALLLALLLALPITAGAQDGPEIAVVVEPSCDQATFSITISGGSGSYELELDFGDAESYSGPVSTDGLFKLSVPHTYPHGGDFVWILTITDANGLEETTTDTVIIDGPIVSLDSIPSPPLLTIDGGEASIEFIASVSGGVAPYFYSWDLDEDNSPDPGLSSDTAPYTYKAGGNYKAAVTVTDSNSCGLTHTATLTVVVVDPEADPQDACHPTAQKIAEAVSIIFLSDRAESTYTCEDIFNFFEGGLTGSQIGFGRMWKAYQLIQTIDDLTWEEIRDWKLEYSSWGALAQLNRVSALLEEHGIRDLMDLVMSEEYTLGDIRTAARSVLRYEADFDDALLRISEGANPGELGQFYTLAAEMDVDLATLDQYLDDGTSLSELRHAAKMSERTDSDWTEIIDAKSSGHSWGDIGQAYKLTDDGTSAADILNFGVQEFRSKQREEERALREDERAQRDKGANDRTADRYAEQYGMTAGEVLAILNGDDCDGSWGCVRKALREGQQTQASNDRGLRTAEQLAAKYDGVTTEQVLAQYELCSENWNCVRAHYRELDREPRGKDKKK
jgi:PKD repeat protein